MHDYIKNLAVTVRTAKEDAGLSQAALAEQLGCDNRTILNIENNRGNPKFEILFRLSLIYRFLPIKFSIPKYHKVEYISKNFNS